MMLAAPAILVVALAASAAPPPAQPAQPTEKPAPPRPLARPGGRPLVAPTASLPSVEGELEGVDHSAHQLRLRSAGGTQLLSFDRNTVVRGPSGAITPVELAAGMRVRVGLDGAQRAAWVELKPPAPTPSRTP